MLMFGTLSRSRVCVGSFSPAKTGILAHTYEDLVGYCKKSCSQVIEIHECWHDLLAGSCKRSWMSQAVLHRMAVLSSCWTILATFGHVVVERQLFQLDRVGVILTIHSVIGCAKRKVCLIKSGVNSGI